MALRGIVTYQTSTNVTSVNVDVSSIGILDGDIVLIFPAGGGPSGQTFTYPSGFSAVGSLTPSYLASVGQTMDVAYKVASSEPTTYTIGYSHSSGMTVLIRVYSGRNTSAPFTASSSASGSGLSSPVSLLMTAVTAASGDDVVLLYDVDYNRVGGQTYTVPSGYANSQTSIAGGTLYNPLLVASDYVSNPGGSTGTAAGTFTTGAAGNGFTGYTLSIAAASGSGGSPIAWLHA